MSIKKSFENIITEINQDNNLISDEVKNNTPERIEIFYKEIFSGLKIDPKVFLEKTFVSESNDLILEKNITFYSMCEHHFLPFFGKIHIAYIPNEKIVGFGDLIKVTEVFCKRPQLQERLIKNIADTIFDSLNAKGVFVMIEAEHTCMTMRGVKAFGSKMITTTTRGVFSEDLSLKSEVLTLINL